MSEKPGEEQRSKLTRIFWICVALWVYVASIAPVGRVLDHGPIYRAVYYPILKLADRVPLVGDWLEWYSNLREGSIP